MFERFTERARQVIVLAQEEARTNKVRYIGPEHILVGLLREEEGLAARVLKELGVDNIEKAREHVAATSSGEPPEDGKQIIPFTVKGKKALELALREALSLGHNYIGTEHVLLGLVRDGDNLATGILHDNYKIEPDDVRKEVIRMLSGKRAPQLKKPGSDADAPPAAKRAIPTTADDMINVVATAVTLGRQYPERSALDVAHAAFLLANKG